MQWRVWTCAVLILVSLDALGASGAVTETEAIRMFLQGSPQARLVSLRAEAADLEGRIGTEVWNPTVAYQIEDAAGVRDEFLLFEQELPTTGRRSLLRKRAAANAAATELSGARDLLNATYLLKGAFHEVLYRDRGVAILRQGGEELERIVAVLRERERQGEAAGYDVLRTEQEAAGIRMELGSALAAADRARARFGSFFDASRDMGSVVIEGDLSPAGALPAAEGAIATALANRTDLRALHEEGRRQGLEVRAARRRRFPNPTLVAGWKRVEALDESDTGFVASLMVPVPIFDRGKFTAAHAGVVLQQVKLRREILEREIRAEVMSSLARAQAARGAVEQLGAPVEHRAVELQRITQLAYDEGEKDLLDLLDVFRSSLRMELQLLAVRHEAKQAQIELERVMGREVSP